MMTPRVVQLAFHCNTARYHLALSRDGQLPRALSRTHPRYGSPVAASAAQLGLLAAAVIGAIMAGRQPAHEPSDDDHARIADARGTADAAIRSAGPAARSLSGPGSQ